jgi:hypothetical protein
VRRDLARLCRAYSGRRIDLLEAGCPSGALTQSSEAMQADFVSELFAAWDAHSDQIELVTLDWQTDLSSTAVDWFKNDYGIADPVFLDFLGSLGMRTWPGHGRSKRAFARLVAESQSRSR